MGSGYEFALTCDLKDDISQEVIDVLYMTRSSEQDYDFTTTLKHPLFTSSEDGSLGDGLDYLADWKLIISNSSSYGEESYPGIFGSVFKDRKLSIRKFVDDDTFNNTFCLLVDWLASVCYSHGFVGYYLWLMNFERNRDPVIVYFEDGQVFKKHLTHKLMPLESYLGE
ncbi:hypothetical protein [Chamaesiphon sp. GL140_3_metabinner_50]|uniref:hypothetical protein n=1 Tax=Chamaesiphon sp. GL140_3_metabinner_50 TaxID=2970812 RepID=UPI0025E92CA1|nr:hypothetical protein [Chamaesiphon sp. GL140_3_metabinner_50]